MYDLLKRAIAQSKVGESIIDKMAELAAADGLITLKTFEDELVEVNEVADLFAEEITYREERRTARTAGHVTTW